MAVSKYLIIFAILMATWTWQVISYFQFQEQVQKFQSKGPRFTAIDGQDLCERVQKLEKEPKECPYLNRTK
jgi:hypothetical protein